MFSPKETHWRCLECRSRGEKIISSWLDTYVYAKGSLSSSSQSLTLMYTARNPHLRCTSDSNVYSFEEMHLCEQFTTNMTGHYMSSRYWTNESYENTHKTIHLLHFGRDAPVSVIHLASRKRPGWTVVWTQHNTTQSVVMKNGGWQGGRVDVSNVNLVGKRHRFLNDFFGVSWWNFLESHGLSARSSWKTKSSRPDEPKAGPGPGAGVQGLGPGSVAR